MRVLARRYGINPKTVDKVEEAWLHCRSPDWSDRPRSSVLSVEQEAMLIAFRKYTLLPLEDCKLWT